MNKITSASSQKCITLFVDWRKARYRFTLYIDPSLTSAVEQAIIPFFKALDAKGDLRKLSGQEKIQFTIQKEGIEIQKNSQTQIIRSSTAQKISKIFHHSTQKEQHEGLMALGKTAEGVGRVQELPNVGNTCFLNAAMASLCHPSLLSELLKYPKAFKPSSAKKMARKDPDEWPCRHDPREKNQIAQTYRNQLHLKAKNNPSLFAGGAKHPLFIVLSKYHNGIEISSEEMRDLTDRLVLDQKCSLQSAGEFNENAAPFGLARFAPYEQMDVGEALTAIRAQIDCAVLKKCSSLISTASVHFSTEEMKTNPKEQVWIPVLDQPTDLFFPEVEINPNFGLLEGLKKKFYDTSPDSAPLKRGDQTFIRKAQREIFNTVPSHLVVGMSQTVPSFDLMSDGDQKEFLAVLQSCMNRFRMEERPSPLRNLDLNEKGVLGKIFADPTLFQQANDLVFEQRKRDKKRPLYIPFKKQASQLTSVPLSFKTPAWFSQDGKEEEMELTGFPFHGGGVAGGHYWAYVRRGNRYYQVDDRVQKAPPKEISQEEFLALASQARKLIYARKR